MSDKIAQIAERLSEQMPPHFRKAETARAERILREELEGLMEAAGEVADIKLERGDKASVHDVSRIVRLAQLLAEYGWPWRKSK